MSYGEADATQERWEEMKQLEALRLSRTQDTDMDPTDDQAD